jgi:hypothetical protein
MAIDLEEFQLILLRDPAVKAGRLEVQAMLYLCRPGTMVRNGIPVTLEG